MITALIVARPLVLGEDPGLLLRPWSDASGMILTLLWFVVALAWSIWRACIGEHVWFVGGVEAALLVVVVLTFVSAAFSAACQYPAWLIAWEWLALFVAFCLIRHLARGVADQQRILAALVASAVSLSAYAVYQYVEEFPRTRQQFQSPAELRAALAGINMTVGDDDSTLQKYRQRIEFNYVFATFSHPNSFAGFLALLLPATAGWAIVSLGRGRHGPTLAAVFLALLTAGALALTHSRGAILGTALAAAAGCAVGFGRRLWAYKFWALAAVILLGVVVERNLFHSLASEASPSNGMNSVRRAAQGNGLEKSRRSFGLRLDYWATTWRMIRDKSHPRFLWLGVGPGNFGRYYPRYMPAQAHEEVKDPHNFALETWASSGFFALLALLTALALLLRHLWPAVRESDRSPLTTHDPPLANDAPRTFWEYYVGAMIGLTLGFILWASERTGETAADEILIGGIIWGARSLIWFAAFALWESIAWVGPGRVLALAIGIVALLINLCVSGGIGFPSVALPLWAIAALALNAAPKLAAPRQTRLALVNLLPVPACLAICFVYFSNIFSPVVECNSYLEDARKHSMSYLSLLGTAAADKTDAERLRILHTALGDLRQDILPPLEKAVRIDPRDPYAQRELANWLGQDWMLVPNIEVRKRAIIHADAAIQLDPDNVESYLTLYHLDLLFARQADAKAAEFHRLAATAMLKAVERKPTSAVLRFQLAEILFLAGDAVEGREQARIALDFDEQSAEPTRKLSDPQRQQVRLWLGRS